MTTFLTGAAVVIAINAFLCLYRAILGPTVQDRVLSINIVATKTLSVLVLLTFIFKSALSLDVAIMYALLNFIVTVTVSRYLEVKGWEVNQVDR